MKLLFNLLCRDMNAQLRFYAALLGLTEIAAQRTPIYCALAMPHSELGFNAWPAYSLLGLAKRSPSAQPAQSPTATTGFPTFMLAHPEDVNQAESNARRLGGVEVKPPYASYYGHWQTVLSDPEHNVLRLSCSQLPQGVNASAPPF